MSNSNFIIKFELPSARVKRVCFHPSRPWVLCGLHNGRPVRGTYTGQDPIHVKEDSAWSKRRIYSTHRVQRRD